MPRGIPRQAGRQAGRQVVSVNAVDLAIAELVARRTEIDQAIDALRRVDGHAVGPVLVQPAPARGAAPKAKPARNGKTGTRPEQREARQAEVKKRWEAG